MTIVPDFFCQEGVGCESGAGESGGGYPDVPYLCESRLLWSANISIIFYCPYKYNEKD